MSRRHNHTCNETEGDNIMAGLELVRMSEPKEIEVAVSIEDQEVMFVEEIDDQLKWLIWNWESNEVSEDTPPERRWWEFWKIDNSRKKSLLVVGRYLLEGLDDFIKIARSKGDPLNYKATIMAAITTLYESVIKSAKMPWWLKPFGGSLQTLVINVLASLLIDYIVRRYETGQFS